MRQFGFIVATLLIGSDLAAAPWKEYPQPQLGFIIEFPADPVVSTGMYRTIIVPAGAPAHIFRVREDHAIYVVTVVDLLDRKEEGATLLGEAEFNFTNLGDVVERAQSRVETGLNAVWGRFITIECRSNKVAQGQGTIDARAWLKSITGMECPDGTRLTVNIFFNRGRLYLVHGMNVPTGEGNSFGPAALRFTNSISFFLADGTRDPADGKR